tara:strand:- start:300 stop:557 length:258 start_codon:yes stop_codon:yes gene_type:complete
LPHQLVAVAAVRVSQTVLMAGQVVVVATAIQQQTMVAQALPVKEMLAVKDSEAAYTVLVVVAAKVLLVVMLGLCLALVAQAWNGI